MHRFPEGGMLTHGLQQFTYHYPLKASSLARCEVHILLSLFVLHRFTTFTMFATGFFTEFETLDTLGHRTLHLRSSAGPGWFAVCSKANISMPKNQACQAYHLTSSDSKSALPLTQDDQHLSILFICFAGGQAQRQKQSCRWHPEMCTSARLPFLRTKSESRNFDQFGILMNDMNVVHILLMNIDEYCTFVMICSTVSLYHFLFILSHSFTVTSFSSCFSIMSWVSNWVVGACVRRTSKQWQFKFELPWSRLAPNQVCKQQSKVMKFHEVTISKSSIYIYIYICIYIYMYNIYRYRYSQYVLEHGPMEGAFIARCGALASDGPKIGPDFATAPMVPSHADAPWFGHWFWMENTVQVSRCDEYIIYIYICGRCFYMLLQGVHICSWRILTVELGMAQWLVFEVAFSWHW